MPKRRSVFFRDSFPNYGYDDVDDAGVDDASVDDAGVDHASVEDDLLDRPGNKRGAGVRDGLAAARAEGGLDTIFELILLFFSTMMIIVMSTLPIVIESIENCQ